MNDVKVGLVCFRLIGSNQLNQKLLTTINASGRLHMVTRMVLTVVDDGVDGGGDGDDDGDDDEGDADDISGCRFQPASTTSS